MARAPKSAMPGGMGKGNAAFGTRMPSLMDSMPGGLAAPKLNKSKAPARLSRPKQGKMARLAKMKI